MCWTTGAFGPLSSFQGALQVGHPVERLAGWKIGQGAMSRQLSSNLGGELRTLIGFRSRVDTHGGLLLAGMDQQRLDLEVVEPDGRLHMVGEIGLPQQQVIRSVGCQVQLGEEVRVAGGHQCPDGEEAGMAMIGMQAVTPPRIVAEHDGRPQCPENSGHLSAPVDIVKEFAVDATEELDPIVTQGIRCPITTVDERRRRPTLVGPGGYQCIEVGVGVPAALRAVGEHQVVDAAPAGRPSGQGGATSELLVVRVGSKGQGGGWYR